MGSLARQQGRGKRKSQAQIDDEARQAYEMRLSGLRTDQIADRLGISVGTVVNRVKHGGERAVTPAVEEYREMINARLEGTLQSLLAGISKRGQGMTARDAEVIVKIEEAQAKLYGANAPTQIEQTVTLVEGGIDAEVHRLTHLLGLNDPESESV